MAAGYNQRDEAILGKPFLEIVEQPCKSIRYRYGSDKTVTAIYGIGTVGTKRTYTTITIRNYIGPATIIVSCVTAEKPYRPHPHYLIGKKLRHDGIWVDTFKFTKECKEYKLKNVGIQCTRRWDIARALEIRADALRHYEIEADFFHIETVQNVDMSTVRLCFQVLIGQETRQCLLPKVISNEICDNKSNLMISRASAVSGLVQGGTQLVIFCGKLTKSDIKVVFYLEDDTKTTVWKVDAKIDYIHKGVAILLYTPQFHDVTIKKEVTVQFRLECASLDTYGNSLPFTYIPDYPAIRYSNKPISAHLYQYHDQEPPSFLQPNNQYLPSDDSNQDIQMPSTSRGIRREGTSYLGMAQNRERIEPPQSLHNKAQAHRIVHNQTFIQNEPRVQLAIDVQNCTNIPYLPSDDSNQGIQMPSTSRGIRREGTFYPGMAQNRERIEPPQSLHNKAQAHRIVHNQTFIQNEPRVQLAIDVQNCTNIPWPESETHGFSYQMPEPYLQTLNYDNVNFEYNVPNFLTNDMMQEAPAQHGSHHTQVNEEMETDSSETISTSDLLVLTQEEQDAVLMYIPLIK